MNKLAFCNELCEGWSLDRVFELAQEVGFDAVEIAPFTLAENVGQVDFAGRRAIRKMAEEVGVEIVGLHWLFASPPGLHFNDPLDPEKRARTREYLCDLMEFCNAIGGDILVFGSPKQRSVPEGGSYDQVWELTRDQLVACMPTAEKYGVYVCLEPLSTNETNFWTSAEETIRMIREVDHPRLRLHLDAKAMSYEEKPIPQVIRESAEYFHHFHANDPNLLGPGMGDLDFEPIVEALRDVDYQGYVSVEVFDFRSGPEKIVKQSYDYLRKVFG